MFSAWKKEVTSLKKKTYFKRASDFPKIKKENSWNNIFDKKLSFVGKWRHYRILNFGIHIQKKMKSFRLARFNYFYSWWPTVNKMTFLPYGWPFLNIKFLLLCLFCNVVSLQECLLEVMSRASCRRFAKIWTYEWRIWEHPCTCFVCCDYSLVKVIINWIYYEWLVFTKQTHGLAKEWICDQSHRL